MLHDEAATQKSEMMTHARRQESTKLGAMSLDQRKEMSWMTKQTKFEDFNVLRTLGEGGFGKVLLVSKKVPQQDEPAQFALKVLKKSFIVDSGNVTRALAEKELLQSLRHPFIVRLYHAFMNDMHLFLCMTYVGGGELYSLMEQFQNFRHQGIPEVWARFYGTEIALALDHLHKNGVLYRDLKVCPTPHPPPPPLSHHLHPLSHHLHLSPPHRCPLLHLLSPPPPSLPSSTLSPLLQINSPRMCSSGSTGMFV
jgi:hypothetical protein